jgi:predicted PurR-regulated permease PerM/GNAT superfamily N-acetyltransferase
MSLTKLPISPPWSSRTKHQIAVILLILALLALYAVRSLLIPLIMSIMVAYVVLPMVNLLHERTPLNRNGAIAIVYLTIVAALIAIPAYTIPQLIREVNQLLTNTPRYLEQLGALLSHPVTIAGYTIPLDQLRVVEEAYASLSANLLEIIRTVGGHSFVFVGSVATVTISTVGWIVIILVLSFYMVKDHRHLFGSLVDLVPVAYREDMYHLAYEISTTWNAFLRGQLTLSLVVGGITFVVASFIGLPNALLLALLAALFEFIPTLGPVLAAIPAVLVAFFQSNASWLGSQMSPFWFALLVVGVYILIQQFENMVLIPRIIGRTLNLHPLIVWLGALAGYGVAGILGVLLAAPVLATFRLIFLYIYRKMADVPPEPVFLSRYGNRFMMTRPFEPVVDEHPIQLRVAKPEDEAAVRALSEQIWNGEDYVPELFHEWVADERGQFTVAYDGDELVAFNKLTELSAGEWWLEGLRVHVRHRGRGLARLLHNYACELADQRGKGMLRFATGSDNVPIQKIAVDSGFRLVSRHLIASLDIKNEDGAGATMSLPFLPVAAEELPQLETQLQHSQVYRLSGGLLEDEWVWLQIKPRLAELQQAERLYWWCGPGGKIRGLLSVKNIKQNTLWLNFVDVDEDDWAELAGILPNLALARNTRIIEGKPLATPVIRDTLEAAGWKLDSETEMWLYERALKRALT